MNFETYNKYFDEIVNSDNPQAPYNDPMYLDYTKLNHSRTKRWLKHGVLNADLVDKIKNIKAPQTWVVITEPWCGDAAHSVPFIQMLSELNENITVDVQLRDSGSEIDSYLTNGGKSVPKLIIRNENKEDILIWGPRPKDCQKIYDEVKNRGGDFDEIKESIQVWYNKNKGVDIQEEILSLMQ